MRHIPWDPNIPYYGLYNVSGTGTIFPHKPEIVCQHCGRVITNVHDMACCDGTSLDYETKRLNYYKSGGWYRI